MDGGQLNHASGIKQALYNKIGPYQNRMEMEVESI